jgi:DNA-binding LacI/PurR family transcriptional regulator
MSEDLRSGPQAPQAPQGTQGHRPVTLEEVASRAGLSRATVSRVINDSPRVSEATRSAVERAVEELGYVPNRAARSLVTQRTESVALVIAEPEARLHSEPFFTSIIRGVSDTLSASTYQLVLMLVQGSRERERLERYLGGRHVDGVLLLSLHESDPLPAALRALGLPTVLGGRPTVDLDLAYVDADNRGGAVQAVRHLLASGRERIATISGPPDMPAGVDRRAGYCDALDEAGVTVDETLMATGDFSQSSGAAAMEALLHRRPDLDAVFAASDLMAVGALQTLLAAGRRVPADVAVVGFDDSIAARSTRPALSSVHQPMQQMGQEMARLVLDEIEGRSQGPRRVVLGTELVVRESG